MATPAPKLQIEIHITHQDCLNAAAWRETTKEAGFPPFEPVLHERYNTAAIYLKCVACGTVIRHSTGHTNEGIDPS
jgi:hypothetical protein